MKGWLNSAAPLAAGILLATVAGCNHSPTSPGPRVPPEFTADEQSVADASTGFGLELLRQVYPAAQKPNLLLSPLSVSMALGMTMNGALGDTYDAMRRTLGFGDLAEADINAAYQSLIQRLHGLDSNVEFRLANSIWYEQTFTVEAPFLDAARSYFDAQVQALDFSSPAAPGIINQWVADATGNRITDLIQGIDPQERLFLVNAVYFKAPWSSTFNEDATADGPFTRMDGTTVAAPLMHQDAALPWFQDDQVQGVELPYGDSAFSMILIAPRSGTGLPDLLASLTRSRWQQWLQALQPGRVLLTMPRFEFTYDTGLNTPLTDMGMGIAFQPFVADFHRINKDRDDVYITRVLHSTFIHVDELGTEAAGATAVGVGVTSVPPAIAFDHPFLFAIQERVSGTLLFLGVVGDPTVMD